MGTFPSLNLRYPFAFSLHTTMTTVSSLYAEDAVPELHVPEASNLTSFGRCRTYRHGQISGPDSKYILR